MGNEKTKEGRVARPHKIPMEYIEALADRIHQSQPTKEILINTLSGFYSVAYSKAYARRIADTTFFKEKHNKRFEEFWDKVRTEIDDYIHPEKVSKNQKKK